MSYFYDNLEIEEKAIKYHRNHRNMMYALEGSFALVILTGILASYVDNYEIKLWIPLLFIVFGAGLPCLFTTLRYKRINSRFKGKVKSFTFQIYQYFSAPYMLFHPDSSDIKVYNGLIVLTGQALSLRKPLIVYYLDQEVAKFEGLIYPERKDKSVKFTGFCHVCGKVNKDKPEVCSKCGCDLIPEYFE